MRANPDRYSSLVYHNNNENSSKDNNNHSSRQILPPPPYDGYIIEHYKSTLFEESEKLYNGLVDQLVCEVVNENVAKQSAETTPSSLPHYHLRKEELMMGISKTKHNDQEEELDEEQYQADSQYEQDRLTDDNAYSEYFEDDENEANRFTDDYSKISLYSNSFQT